MTRDERPPLETLDDAAGGQRATEVSRSSEARARAISENILELLVVLEAVPAPGGAVTEWRCVDANDRALQLLRRTRQQLIGKTLREVLPEQSTAIAERMSRVATSGEPERYETWLDERALLVTLFRIDASTIGSAALDVTDARRAESALRERESELRLAQRIAHVGSWSWIVGTERLEASEEVFRIYGRDPALPIPANDSDELRRHYTPEGWARRAAVFQRALTQGRAWERDEEIIRVDGSRRWVHFRGEPERDAHGRIVKLRGTIQDITERKLAEDALREADRNKAEFLAILSHELRNPLAPIRNSIHLLDHWPGDTTQAARARLVIRRQTAHLARLVDDLLDVTRISRGKIELVRSVVDLRNVVRRTCEDHRALFEQSDIELHLDFPAGPVWADVDATRIAQVVGNLLQNANKFTPAQGVVVVALRGRDGQAEIRVRDTGIGVEQDKLAHIFEPFTQGDRGLARTRGGLGLGLALAKGFIELHGGAVTVYSDGPGQGTEFVLTVAVAPAPPDTARENASAHPPRVAGRQVLIIEDNVDAAQTLADVLELHGHHVHLARNGVAGIATARELKPDVVLCDIGLPDVDGYEIARTLRTDEAFRATRLIALSGYAQPEDKERARAAGFDAHLAKPAPLAELVMLLE